MGRSWLLEKVRGGVNPSVKRLFECEQLNILEILPEMPVDKCHSRELNARSTAGSNRRGVSDCAVVLVEIIYMYIKTLLLVIWVKSPASWANLSVMSARLLTLP
jgi:hypothetical protein